MKLIKQPTPYSCMACCLAMITGVPLEMIFADLGHDGAFKPFRFLDCAALLNRYGFHLGAYSDSDSAGKRRLICFSWTRGIPALVIVAGRQTGSSHAIYWTGKQVMDPRGTEQPLESYIIKEWWPIIRFKEPLCY